MMQDVLIAMTNDHTFRSMNLWTTGQCTSKMIWETLYFFFTCTAMRIKKDSMGPVSGDPQPSFHRKGKRLYKLRVLSDIYLE